MTTINKAPSITTPNAATGAEPTASPAAAQEVLGSSISGLQSNPTVADKLDAQGGTATVTQPSVELTTGTALSAEMLGEMKALLEKAGVIKGDTADFGDTFFALGKTSGGLTIELNASEQAQLSGVITTAAQMARGKIAGEARDIGTLSNRLASVASDVVGRGGNLRGGDVEALVQYVLREAYLEQTEDLRFFAEKVKLFNETKKAIRSHLADLREIQASLAGIPDDEAANTDLSGNAINSAASGNLGGAPDGGEVVITSPEQRARDYPEAHAAVAEFTSYEAGGVRVPLENLLLNDPNAKQRLLAAIPYMTGEELVKVLAAIGGTDMKVHGDLKGLFGEIVNSLSTGQLLELGALSNEASPLETFGFDSFVIPVGQMLQMGDLNGLLTGRIAAAKATAEAQTGRTFGSYDDALSAWQTKRADEIHQQRRDAVGAADAGALEAIDALLAANPDGMISGDEMFKLIKAATEDGDARAASVELEDLRKFVAENRDRLTTGALKVFEAYDSRAQKYADAGKSGIPSNEYYKILGDLKAIAGDYRSADATQVANHDRARQEAASRAQAEAEAAAEAARQRGESLEQVEGQLDVDASDGTIDKVMVTNEPPFLRQVPGEKITTKAQLDAHIQELEEALSSVGDDAQLANVDLQNALQKQQQTMQMMSNIAKQMHDTAMNTIRKIAG